MTPTPACSLKCDIDTERYGFSISCESGEAERKISNTTRQTFSTSGLESITVEVNEQLTYKDSNRTYHIVGTIVVRPSAKTVEYDITATGGIFGETPVTCKSPAK